MIDKRALKEIIVSNEDFILNSLRKIVPRDGVNLPQFLNKTVIFFGIRRSGKTFILFSLFQKNPQVSMYIDFEDERLLGFQVEDFERLKEAFFELKPNLIKRKVVFLLDEVQNIKGWERFCRRAVEREGIEIFVSGSSSKVLPAEIRTELRGRAWSIEVLPFSFREYLHSKGVNFSEKSFHGREKILLRKHFMTYLKWGGFPETGALESDFEKNKLLKEYLGAMYFRDLVEKFDMTNIHLLDSLSDKIFSSFSMKLSLSNFYKQYRESFAFSKDHLFSYYKRFLQSMLVCEVRIFTESAYKRMRNPPKLYLIDAGLCKRVSSEDSGRLLENLVFLELKRKGYELFYFEGKRECDFIAKKETDLLPIQVSFELNPGNRERELGGLVEACKWLKLKKGLLLTLEDEGSESIDGINLEVHSVLKWLLMNA